MKYFRDYIDRVNATKKLDKLLERNESVESLPAGYSPEMM